LSSSAVTPGGTTSQSGRPRSSPRSRSRRPHRSAPTEWPKRSDYAAAGIPHYWIVDLDPLSVLECRLGADGAYADQGAVTGAFRTLEPFAIEVDLDALV